MKKTDAKSSKKAEMLTELQSLSKPGSVDLFDRDISWLKFNLRVLTEARDTSIPIYERIKFMAIYSSNMDEFFRVRFANMRRIARLTMHSKGGKKKIRKLTGFLDPLEIIRQVRLITHEQQELYGKTYRESILPALLEAGVKLHTTRHFLPQHQEFIEDYFYTQVLSFLQPIIIEEGEEKEIFLENRHIYLAVEMLDENQVKHLGIVYIPSFELGRFVELPKVGDTYHYAYIDDIVRAHVHILFPGYELVSVSAIKLNRDAELFLENEFSGTLIEKIQNNLSKRKIGNPSRFLYDSSMPHSVLMNLKSILGLDDNDIVPGGRYHNMYDHFTLPNPIGSDLEYPKTRPLSDPHIEQHKSVLKAIDTEDVLLHFPYQRYDYILRYFNEAIISKEVEHIKVALYRVAENSHVVNALISAARNGKQVTVFVEAKARFDEANNLKWAKRMQEVGIDVRFSSLELKVHAKVALFLGHDKSGKPKRWAFFGTGNFNEKTAGIYADHALLTSDDELTQDLDIAFQRIFGDEQDIKLKHLLVAQVNMVEEFMHKIDREISLAQAGRPARIVIKLNNLQDPNIIQKLYDAADAGVAVDLIIRAICCAIPRDNLKIIRIVDKYLEHARVYWFNNDGDEEIYLGSADWMERNLYRRIEVVFPLRNKKLTEEVKACIDFQLRDNKKATYIAKDLSNVPVERKGPAVRAQTDFYDWLVQHHGLNN